MSNHVFCREDLETLPTAHIEADNILKGRLTVEQNLPAELAHGLFARLHAYNITICLAAMPREPGAGTFNARSMSIKVLGAYGPQLAPFHGVPAQEFVLEPSNPVGLIENPVHPMTEEYYSRLPLAYGNSVARFGLVPSSPGLLALKNHPFSPDTPNALHEATVAFFQYNPAEFDFKVQFLGDSAEPLFRTIARLVIPAQQISLASPLHATPYIAA